MLSLLIALTLLGNSPAHAGLLIIDHFGYQISKFTLNDETFLKTCQDDAYFRDKGAKVELNDKCFFAFLQTAAPQAVDMNWQELITVVGFRNVLYTQIKNCPKKYFQVEPGICRFAISGDQTQLDQIVAVSYDWEYNHLLALTRNPARILTFPQFTNGNGAPKYSLSSPELNGSVAIAADAPNEEIFVANQLNSSILVFGREAHNQGPHERHHTQVRRKLSGPKTLLSSPSAIAVDWNHDELFVANASTNQILIFKRGASGNTAPLRTIQGPSTLLDKPINIGYNPQTDEIQVQNSSGKGLRFSRAGNGNTVPQ